MRARSGAASLYTGKADGTMNAFVKQAVRRPVFTILLTLLLSLSIALSCIGCTAWASARREQEEISAAYTTIAIPIEPDLSNRAPAEIASALQNRVYADQAAQKAPMLRAIDRRCLLSAHVPGMRSLSSSRMDPSEYNLAFDGECYALAVFALRCESVAERPAEGTLLYDATFHVERIVALSDAYDCFPAPDTVHIYSDVREADGALPFEAGKTYLVFGEYEERRVVRTQEGYRQMTNENRYLIPFPEMNSNRYGDPSALESGETRGQVYHYPAEGQLPWFSAYSGTVSEFLASDAAAPWRDTILPLCRINHESAAVILTDRVQSLYSFNTGEAVLLSGRFFTDAEYQTGADVCIISAAYAELNGLALGDALTLDVYGSGFGEYSNGATANSLLAAEDPGPYRQRYGMKPDDTLGVCKPYTIVGMYTGPRFAFGAYSCNADTIFLPKASIPGGGDYEMPANALLNSFILENGTAEAFEQALQQQGLGGQFLYFDQGFSSMQVSLKTLESNARRLMLVGIGAFLLIPALFLFLNFRRMRPSIQCARRLGRSRGAILGEVLALLLSLELAAVLLGARLAALLFDGVTGAALSGALVLRQGELFSAAAVMAVLLALASTGCAAIAVNQRLMKSQSGSNGRMS